jgi:hypothetical protein
MWMRMVGLASISLLLLSGASTAGPYFNTPRKEVADLSREAVTQLSDARIQLIQLFKDLDAGSSEKAHGDREQALKLLNDAYARFKEIATKVPNQPLKLYPKSADEEQVIKESLGALASRKLDQPKTEKDLAILAVVIVGNYGDAVRKANLDNFPKNWKGVREIILSEIDLLAIGNLVSIVWTISE